MGSSITSMTLPLLYSWQHNNKGKGALLPPTLRDFAKDFLHLPHQGVYKEIVAIFLSWVHWHHLRVLKLYVFTPGGMIIWDSYVRYVHRNQQIKNWVRKKNQWEFSHRCPAPSWLPPIIRLNTSTQRSTKNEQKVMRLNKGKGKRKEKNRLVENVWQVALQNIIPSHTSRALFFLGLWIVRNHTSWWHPGHAKRCCSLFLGSKAEW